MIKLSNQNSSIELRSLCLMGPLLGPLKPLMGPQKGLCICPQGPFWALWKVLDDLKRTPKGQITPIYLTSVGGKLWCAILYILDHFCIHQGPMAPNLFCKGSIFSCMFFCSGHGHVGCPDRRNGMPWSFYAIKAHTEPSSWRKRPKISFWDPSEAKHDLLEVPGNAQMVWKQAKMYHISGGNPDKNLKEF